MPAPSSSASIGSPSTSPTMASRVRRSDRGNSLKPSAARRAAASASLRPDMASRVVPVPSLRAPVSWVGRGCPRCAQALASSRKLSSLALTSSGQGIEVCLSSQLAASTCSPDQRCSSPQWTVWRMRTDDLPTLRMVSRKVSRSPKKEGLEKSQERWTVGVPSAPSR